MPVYEYLCSACGPFTALRPMAEYQAPQPCPTCAAETKRAILTAPHFALMSSSKRKAHAVNERSAAEPRVGGAGAKGHVHGPNCGCGPRTRTAGGEHAAKGFPGKRPWMISH